MSTAAERSSQTYPEELTYWRQAWGNRCGVHARNHTETWGIAHYASWRQEGSRLIGDICANHGAEATRKLLQSIEGLSLRTQIRLLLLGQSENINYLLPAFDVAYPPEKREERKFQFRFDHHLEESPYREILTAAIAQKYPQENTAALVTAISAAVPKMYGDPIVRAVPAVEAMELALTHGPDFMLEAFVFIPPEEISLENFERRLAIEKQIKETGEEPLEQVLLFTGSVQGVGFRALCMRHAREWGIRGGYARNERNKSVTVLVQAHPSIITGFIAGIEQDMMRRGDVITSIKRLRQGPIGEKLHEFRSRDPEPLPRSDRDGCSPVALFRRIAGR